MLSVLIVRLAAEGMFQIPLKVPAAQIELSEVVYVPETPGPWVKARFPARILIPYRLRLTAE